MSLHKLTVLAAATAALLFTPTAAAQAAPAAPQAQAPASAPVLDLSPDIDRALRWLRYAQDRETGGYGPDVVTTALTLRAMRESPRKYQTIDGPFVARAVAYLVAKQDANGAIADAGVDEPARKRQTRVAAAALTLHADETTKAALGAALKYLSADTAAEAALNPWNEAPLPASKD